MDALSFNHLMDLSIESQSNGRLLKRKIIAGKHDAYGKAWVLVESQNENGESSRQWVDCKFFQSWLNHVA